MKSNLNTGAAQRTRESTANGPTTFHAGVRLIHSRTPHRRSGWWWLRTIALVFSLIALAAICIAIRWAEPILKDRVIETLSARFHGKVELAQFHMSVTHGLQVSGEGLKIFEASDLNIHQPGIQPLIAIGEFKFGADILNLLRTPMRVRRVYLKGLEPNIPAKEQREQNVRLTKERSRYTSTSLSANRGGWLSIR